MNLDTAPPAATVIEEIVETVFADLLTLRPSPRDVDHDRRQLRILNRIAADIYRLLEGRL